MKSERDIDDDLWELGWRSANYVRRPAESLHIVEFTCLMEPRRPAQPKTWSCNSNTLASLSGAPKFISTYYPWKNENPDAQLPDYLFPFILDDCDYTDVYGNFHIKLPDGNLSIDKEAYIKIQRRLKLNQLTD
jgi:hypothetical protein